MSVDIKTTAQRAVLVAGTRTGSSWLTSLLDSHPQIRFFGELFNLENAPITAVCDPEAYLESRLGGGGPHRVVGFKLLYHQARLGYLNDFLNEIDEGRPSEVDWRQMFINRPVTEEDAPESEATWHLLRSSGAKVIHLRRRNLLRRHVSHEILMAGSRARWRGAPTSVPPRVRLAAERLVDQFDTEAAASEKIDGFFAAGPKTVVFYEDLRDDFDRECSRVLQFLGVRITPLDSVRRRTVQLPLRQSIENYREVERALVGTAWEEFLAESGEDELTNHP